jgi:hypothetical protein
MSGGDNTTSGATALDNPGVLIDALREILLLW